MDRLERNIQKALRRTIRETANYIYRRYISPNVRNSNLPNSPRLSGQMLSRFRAALNVRDYKVESLGSDRFMVSVQFGKRHIMNKFDRKHTYKGTINLFDIYNKSSQDARYKIQARNAGALAFKIDGVLIFRQSVSRVKFDGFKLESILKANSKDIRKKFTEIFEEEFEPYLIEELDKIMEEGLDG